MEIKEIADILERLKELLIIHANCEIWAEIRLCDDCDEYTDSGRYYCEFMVKLDTDCNPVGVSVGLDRLDYVIGIFSKFMESDKSIYDFNFRNAYIEVTNERINASSQRTCK